METHPTLGIIGGSGLYAIPGLQDIEEKEVTTPFGKPSAPLMLGTLEGRRVIFLARHGIGHFISPSEVNYRANIFALKTLGVERIISISACGSLREDYAPGDLVIPDQLMDFTHRRARTFFEEGLVAHVGVADPFCPHLSELLLRACKVAGAVVHRGGALITIEGPRFSTRAESNTYRSWGMSVIGMTTSPEAFLAREAEMCYAVMAHITDYDVWHVEAEPVSVEAVIAVLIRNTQVAQQAITVIARDLPDERDCECDEALKTALITKRDVIPGAVVEKLGPLVNKYLT
ncbi:MAG: S-methyl-5'-thioadenosine phosphorylase [Anaerolineales bacterium]|nr:S-methyl-5'-thioadenosine phosphorylase [Anaerolineales bacterium]